MPVADVVVPGAGLDPVPGRSEGEERAGGDWEEPAVTEGVRVGG